MANPEDVLKNIEENVSKGTPFNNRVNFVQNEAEMFFSAGNDKENFHGFVDAMLKGVIKPQERKQLLDELIQVKVGPETPLNERIEFIKEWGQALSAVDKNEEGYQQMIDRLMDGVESQQDKEKIVGALIDCEWDACKDSNPATFMRSTNLFKIAMEQPMNWELEAHPERAQQYREDPVKYMKEQYTVPNVIKERFNKVVQAQKSNSDYKPENTMHNMVFSALNGPMLKHFSKRAREQGISSIEKKNRSLEFLDLTTNKALGVTDANMVISGTYNAKLETMLSRGQTVNGSTKRGHQVSVDEVYDYMEALDNLLIEVDSSYPEGTISNGAHIENNVVDYENKQGKFNEKLRQETKVEAITGHNSQQRSEIDRNRPQEKGPSFGEQVGNFFKAAGKAIGNFFKAIGRAIKNALSSSSKTETTAKVEHTETQQEPSVENKEVGQSGTKKGLETTKMQTAEVDVARESKIEQVEKIKQKIERQGAKPTTTKAVNEQLNELFQRQEQEQKSEHESGKDNKAA